MIRNLRWLRYALYLAALLFYSGTSIAAEGPSLLQSPAPEGAQVYFIEPRDGARLPLTFTVKFGLRGMGVSPAGIEKANTGHHHVLIDLQELPDMNLPLPATANIKHFGGGQTETMITLPPGEYTLQLLLANHLHIPHKPALISKPIKVTVVGDQDHDEHHH